MIKILLSLNLLFTGCSFSPPVVVPQVENEAMVYYQWLAGATPSAYRDELDALERQTGMNPVVRIVRKALVKSMRADAAYEDEVEALGLLRQAVDSPYANTAEARDYQQFALVWKKVLERRLALRDAIKGLDKALEEKQAAVERLQATNAAYDTRIRELNDRIESLNKQIEELKQIEQQMHDREQSLDSTAETEAGG